MKFKLVSDFAPTGDQPQAIDKLVAGIKAGLKHQVLLGVTGSGKTFTIANLVEKVQKPTLIVSHNKTLAAQLYQEFRDFFPQNAVSYFVSYYDYYQPEAYIPQTDTYIQKETEINKEIDRLRLLATTNLLTRTDTIIVASVSCIYNIGSPVEYGRFILKIKKGEEISHKKILERLADLQYERSNYGFYRGTFRVVGGTIEVFPAYEKMALRIEILSGRVEKITQIEPMTGKIVGKIPAVVIYPAKHYMTDPATYDTVFSKIRRDLKAQVKELKTMGRNLEAERLKKRTEYDLEMIAEVGYVNGIENYSRYFDGRTAGEPPYTLLDYFPRDFTLIIDESHMTVPQIRGMYNGDRSRKQTLVNFGFRLPSCLDNRPLRFEEFLKKINQVIYISATPGKWEIKMARSAWQMAVSKKTTSNKLPATSPVVEQLIRPTGLVDPKISVRKTQGQIKDLVLEIEKRVKKGERVLVTTLTKKMAEDLAEFLSDPVKLRTLDPKSHILNPVSVHHLHSDIETLGRADILDDLRSGKYDVVVGINLLREGLDLPEVSLVAILDADKEGFLRSETSLIQTMGRAARHVHGNVVMYADEFTSSMRKAIEEVRRRRKVQLDYNKRYKVVPKSIIKPIRKKLVEKEKEDTKILRYEDIKSDEIEQILPEDRKLLVRQLKREMRQAAKDLNFEEAAFVRDQIKKIKSFS
jgi:excinuclease ABC subunit B